jgi:hypothetical protein
MPDAFRFAGRSRRGRTGSRPCGNVLAAALVFLALSGPTAEAQAPAPAPAPAEAPAAGATVSLDELARRLERLERQNAELAAQNRALTRQLEQLTNQYDGLNRRLEPNPPGAGPPTPPVPAPSPSAPDLASTAPGPPQPAADPVPGMTWNPEYPPASNAPELPPISRFIVGEYDDERGAFVLVRPTDAQRVPFELRLDIQTQARVSNFSRSTDFWTDSTGTRLPVRNFDSTEITRNFFQFSGFGLDPRLQYTAIIFSSTAINDTVYLGWLNYHFNDAVDLRVGNWLVPGTREWYTSYRYTLGSDRLMATTFFRPNISPGIWLQGEPIEGVQYVAMFANSLNRFTQGVERVGSSGAFGGTIWWEPLGDFGLGPSDIENHQSLSTRLGLNLAVSREANQGFMMAGPGNPEDTILRLTNGTPLFRPGALGSGVELESTSVQLGTIDAAFKYRGMSLSGEYFFRGLNGFRTDGSRSPISSLFDQGGLLQTSYFVVPAKVETFGRTSFVTGHFGGGNEFGGGVNWYPQGKRTWRFTCEVLQINHSPAQNFLTGYRAGASGLLLQLQWLTDF